FRVCADVAAPARGMVRRLLIRSTVPHDHRSVMRLSASGFPGVVKSEARAATGRTVSPSDTLHT
ncbi:hypothetical protein ACWCW2_21840, partial [Streptomyces sp. NPDC001773]